MHVVKRQHVIGLGLAHPQVDELTYLRGVLIGQVVHF